MGSSDKGNEKEGIPPPPLPEELPSDPIMTSDNKLEVPAPYPGQFDKKDLEIDEPDLPSDEEISEEEETEGGEEEPVEGDEEPEEDEHQEDDMEDVPDSLPNIPQIEGQVEIVKETEIPYFEPEVEFEDLPVIDTEDEAEMFMNVSRKQRRLPLYVRTDAYGEILSNIDIMESHVENSLEAIYGLENLKKNADIEHKKFKKTLEDMQRKLIFIDRTLFKP